MFEYIPYSNAVGGLLVEVVSMGEIIEDADVVLSRQFT